MKDVIERAIRKALTEYTDPDTRSIHAADAVLQGLFGSNSNSNIYVGVWDHEHGTEIRAFRSPEGVEGFRREIAYDLWDHEFPDDEKPEDPREVADQFFEMMGDRTGHWQWFLDRSVLLED